MKNGFTGFRYNFTHKDKEGNVIEKWSQDNALANEGEQNILDVYFRDQNAPTTFFLRLYNDTPVETDTLADLLGEPSTNGYAAQELTRDTSGFPTLALDSGDFQVVSDTVTFIATGGSWGAVTYLVLATSDDNSGKLIGFVALSGSRTLANGESLEVTLTQKLQ